jgi:type II secretory pathway pseudopilin PulG
MEEQITGLKSLLQSLAEESQGDHLEPEKLVAYHFKKLPSDEAEQTQNHLVMCRQCTALLLDLAAFCAPQEGESERSSRMESEAAWAGLRALLQAKLQARQSPDPSRPSFFQRLRELTFPARLASALAILSLALSLALGFWLISVNRENQALTAQINERRIADDQDNLASQKALAEASKEIEAAQRQRDEAHKRADRLEARLAQSPQSSDYPATQINIPVVSLRPGGPRAAGDDQSLIEPIELPAGAASFTLIIPAYAPDIDNSDHTLEIINQRDAVVLVRKGLRPVRGVGFTILLSCRLLPAGLYHFNVYRLDRSKKERVSGGVARISYK